MRVRWDAVLRLAKAAAQQAFRTLQISADRANASRGRNAADVKAAIRRANDEKAAQWAAAVLADRAAKAAQRQQKLAEIEALRVQVTV